MKSIDPLGNETDYEYDTNHRLSKVKQPADVAMFAFGLIVSLLMIIWMVALMYLAYTVSCNAKGAKAIVTFIIALIIAAVL